MIRWPQTLLILCTRRGGDKVRPPPKEARPRVVQGDVAMTHQHGQLHILAVLPCLRRVWAYSHKHSLKLSFSDLRQDPVDPAVLYFKAQPTVGTPTGAFWFDDPRNGRLPKLCHGKKAVESRQWLIDRISSRRPVEAPLAQL